MSETIKLFGKTIPYHELLSGAAPADYYNPEHNRPCADSLLEEDEEKETLGGNPTEAKQKDEARPLRVKKPTDPNETSGISENPRTPLLEETAPMKESEKELSETSVSQEKTLKKPDKIIPCPRCNSMDTKFCYYNNYNVNQARHFCKSCQRYWTAGGTMRNVPVGAGRRKSKNSASHYRHIAISISEALQHSQTDIPNGVHHPLSQTNGTVLTFGSDSKPCESMASVLDLAKKTMLNGFQKHEDIKIPVSDINQENGDDRLDGSSVATSAKNDVLVEPDMQNCQGFSPRTPCFPGAPWPYPWNLAPWSSPVPPPFFFPPVYPIPFYPTAPYWGCAVPGSFNTPWFLQPPSLNQTAQTSGPNSSTLGKHSREENMNPLKPSNSDKDETHKENNSRRCLWNPKTRRIDDPGEAAKSSIWATLGLKYDKTDSISRGGLFKALESKVEEKNHMVGTCPILQANPAALVRSLNFQESS